MNVLIVLTLCLQGASEPKGITTDDYFSLSYLSSCAISPNATYTAWTEGRWDEVLDRRNTDIWIALSDGNQKRRLTFDEAYDGSIQWGANEEWLYFSSRRGSRGDDLPRNGKKQIWRIHPDGTQLMAVTRLSTSVVDWEIAADGESIYYTLDDETQLDDGWKSLRSSHPDVEYGHGVIDYSEIWNLNLQTWKHSKVWDEDAVIQFFSPSPSGNQIAIITTPDNRLITNEGWSTIGIYDVETDETLLLNDSLWRSEAPSPYGWVESPQWSSDGTRLVFSVDFDGYPREMFVATVSKGSVVEQKVERINEVTLGSSPTWIPNTHNLLYIAEDKTFRPLLKVSSVGAGIQGKTTEVITNNLICWDYSVSKNTTEIAAIVTTSNSLAKVVRVADKSNFVQIIVDPNTHILDWNLPSVQTVSWEASDGTLIEGVLELPHGYEKTDGPLPMYVNLHGGPTSAETCELEISMYGRGLLSSNGWAVFSPNYRGSTGYGDAFLTDLIGRENDIEVQDILKGIDAMIERGYADADKLAVGGWSNGGYLTNCLIAATPRFKAASSGAGVFDQTMQWAIEDTPGHVVNYAQGLPWTAEEELRAMSPIFQANNITTPTIIHVGAGDARVPAEQSKALYRSLHDYLDVPTQLVIYPNTGHGLSKMSHRKAKIEWDHAWLQRWVFETEPVAEPSEEEDDQQ